MLELDGTTFVTSEDVDSLTAALEGENPAGKPTTDIDGLNVWSRDAIESGFDIDSPTLDQMLASNSIELIDHNDTGYLNSENVETLWSSIKDQDRLDRLNDLDPDTEMSVGYAAKLVGVNRRYLVKVIANHQQFEFESVDVDSRAKDWLPAHRLDPTNPKSHWRIRASDLADFVERRQPPAVRIGYDVTFTFEKSISVVGLFAEGRDRDAFTAAVTDANKVGLDWLDEHASDGRQRGKAIHTEGLTVASFVHSTSRDNDPFVHVHNLVVNAVEDQNGTGRALDGRNLYLQGPTASALASAELRWQLAQRLGVQWTATGKGVEIAGISQSVIDEFSTGRNRIDSIIEEAGLEGAGARSSVQRSSRPAKSGTSPDQFRDGWLERAAEHGLRKDVLHESILHQDQPIATPRLTEDEVAELHKWLASSEGATNTTSIFTRADVLRSIGEWTPEGSNHVRIMPAAEVARVGDAFLNSELAVPLDLDKDTVARLSGKTSSKIRHTEVFSTTRMINIQEEINESWTKGLDADAALVDPAALDAALTQGATLNEAQADLVRQWTTSGQQFQSAVGVPGAGKTHTMNAAKQAWETDGYRVLGGAIAGSAAQQLGDDTAIPSETLAYYFNQIDRFDKQPFDARTVLIVDEAGTVPDEDLGRLLNVAAETGMAVRFLGDPEQHGAVNPGGMWKHLADTYSANTPFLEESYRYKDSPVDVEVNRLIRAGDIAEAFDVLKDNGRLTEVGSQQEALAVSLRTAIEARDAGMANPMIERANSNRILLNEAMQQVRYHRNEVTDLTQYGHRSFGVGDEIISKRNDRELHPTDQPEAYLRNGTQGRITAIDVDTRMVTGDFGNGEVQLPPEHLDSGNFELAYAVTSNAIQGATLPTNNARSQPGATKAELVVNLSRGERDNSLILSGDSDEEFSKFYDTPDIDLSDRVAQSIAASEDVPAAVVDTTAMHRKQLNLARLERQGGTKAEVQLAEEAIAREVLADPPENLTDQLPPRSTVPHLAHRYDDAIVNASIYRARYTPYSSTEQWGNVLGARPTPNDQNDKQIAHYDDAHEQLHSIAVGTVMRAVDQAFPHGDDATVPVWLESHVEYLAASGQLNSDFDPTKFAQWSTTEDASIRNEIRSIQHLDPLPNAGAPVSKDLLAAKHDDALGKGPDGPDVPQEDIEHETSPTVTRTVGL